MSENTAQIGMNRTGIAMSPLQSKEVIESAKQGAPSSGGDRSTQNALKAPYIKEKALIGSLPPPGTLKGLAKTALKMLQGENANVLIDKLGERLAFERTGTRLYEAIIAKAELAEPTKGGPTLAELKTIHDEELRHFHMLTGYIERLGADPTVITPSADITGVASSGLLKVITDARTTLFQSLEAVLIAELADHDCWSTLIRLAEGFGQDEMVNDFRKALEAEKRHLAQVRGWLSAHVMTEAGV